MDRVVVIGGAGFIGRAVTRRLVENGYAVTVVSRSAGSGAKLAGVQYCRGGVADAGSMMNIIAGAKYVYDLSMSLGTTWADYERDYVGGARNVAAACLKHGVLRLIYTSSISALYLGSGQPVTEAMGHDSQPLSRGFYGRGKIEAERVFMTLHAEKKLPVVITRPGVVLGPGGMLVHGALGEQVSDLFILGFGPGTYPLPCVLAEDVAQALVAARDVPGIDGMAFNLAGDVRPTAREYVEELRSRTLRNYRFIPRPVWKIGMVDRFKWGLKLLIRKRDNVCEPYRDYKSLTMSSYLDCSLAKQKLGWNPISDRQEFFRQVIDCHLKPFHSGDVRLRHLRAEAATGYSGR